MKGRSRNQKAWGWKLPETTMVLSSVLQAFPGARVIHLVRDPVDTCLRRTHLTSRWDTHLGRAVMRAAQQHCGIKLDPSSCPPHLANAVSWEFQLSKVLPSINAVSPERFLQVSYEAVCDDPQQESDRIAAFLSLPKRESSVGRAIDASRRSNWSIGDDRVEVVRNVCKSAALLGYE
jgi:hypothetical protein